MSLDPRLSSRIRQPSAERPRVDRAEHANLDRRPGALLHPLAGRSSRGIPTGWDLRAGEGPLWR